jgi:hypothetical protein
MKVFYLFLYCALSLSAVGCDIFVNDSSQPDVKAYYDYSIINKRVPDSPDTTFTMFHVGKANFDSYFFMIYDHKTPEVISEADFDKKVFLSFAKCGNYASEITLDKSEEKDGFLCLYFTTVKYPSPSCRFAHPVIIAMDKYHKVKIIENNIFLRNVLIE